MHAISPTFPNAIVLHITSSYVPPMKPRGNEMSSGTYTGTGLWSGHRSVWAAQALPGALLHAALSASFLQCPRCLYPHYYAISGSLIFIDLMGKSVSSVLFQRAFSPSDY